MKQLSLFLVPSGGFGGRVSHWFFVLDRRLEHVAGGRKALRCGGRWGRQWGVYYSGLRVDGTITEVGGLYGSPSKRHLGVPVPFALKPP